MHVRLIVAAAVTCLLACASCSRPEHLTGNLYQVREDFSTRWLGCLYEGDHIVRIRDGNVYRVEQHGVHFLLCTHPPSDQYGTSFHDFTWHYIAGKRMNKHTVCRPIL